ncbi:rhodanese-like domain-containing protein [Metabacillus litoralis]|uniref:rhodanese-like domain-containing protein n=1 Tax=Metabacillus litoralis TaxID=152268 RepID=UPI001CFD7FD5|nr:rhodanese-like domain-containing protein [Metabacillus litoralis]
MEYVNYLIIGLVIFLFIQRLFPAKGVEQISTLELKKNLNDKNKQYIDVRTEAEFNGRNIKGFKNIPLHQLNQRSDQLSKDKEVIVICQSGMRSNKASKLLRKKGFKKMTNVKGGMSAWS